MTCLYQSAFIATAGFAAGSKRRLVKNGAFPILISSLDFPFPDDLQHKAVYGLSNYNLEHAEAFALLNLAKSVALVATLGSGLLAGILVGTGMAEFTARGLPESSWVMRFQLEDRLFAKAMPPLMLGTLLALIAASLLARGNTRFALGISVLFLVFVLVVTVGFEVPLNKQILSWTPGSAPPTWQHVRDLWLQRHLLRTISSVLSFICALIASARIA